MGYICGKYGSLSQLRGGTWGTYVASMVHFHSLEVVHGVHSWEFLFTFTTRHANPLVDASNNNALFVISHFKEQINFLEGPDSINYRCQILNNRFKSSWNLWLWIGVSGFEPAVGNSVTKLSNNYWRFKEDFRII